MRAARAAQQEEQQKLRSACFQVQQAVQMVEEANFCKARVRFKENDLNSPSHTVLLWPVVLLRILLVQMELQCEQMSREVAQHRQRSEQECQALQKRLNEARDEGRTEVQKRKEELEHAVKN